VGDFVAAEKNFARGGRKELGEEIEARGLACAVGPDKRVNTASFDLQINVAHSDEAPEFFDEAFCF
jgi:hypothetical protein